MELRRKWQVISGDLSFLRFWGFLSIFWSFNTIPFLNRFNDFVDRYLALYLFISNFKNSSLWQVFSVRKDSRPTSIATDLVCASPFPPMPTYRWFSRGLVESFPLVLVTFPFRFLEWTCIFDKFISHHRIDNMGILGMCFRKSNKWAQILFYQAVDLLPIS